MVTTNHWTADWSADSLNLTVRSNAGVIAKVANVATLQSAGAIALASAGGTVVGWVVMQPSRGLYEISFVF